MALACVIGFSAFTLTPLVPLRATAPLGVHMAMAGGVRPSLSLADMALLSWSARTATFLNGAEAAAFAEASPATPRRGLGAIIMQTRVGEFIKRKLAQRQQRVANKREAIRMAEAQRLVAEKRQRLAMVKSWYDSGRRLTDPWARQNSAF